MIAICRHREYLRVNPYHNVLQPLVPTRKIPKCRVTENAER